MRNKLCVMIYEQSRQKKSSLTLPTLSILVRASSMNEIPPCRVVVSFRHAACSTTPFRELTNSLAIMLCSRRARAKNNTFAHAKIDEPARTLLVSLLNVIINVTIPMIIKLIIDEVKLMFEFFNLLSLSLACKFESAGAFFLYFIASCSARWHEIFVGVGWTRLP